MADPENFEDDLFADLSVLHLFDVWSLTNLIQL